MAVGKPFQKGQSGNPNGRPKADPDVVARLRELCPKAVERLAAMVDDPNHKQHYNAVESVLNRVLGMPKQPIGLEDDGNAIAGGLSQFMAILAGVVSRGEGCSNEPSKLAEDTQKESDPA